MATRTEPRPLRSLPHPLEAYVDTPAFIAFLDRSDSHHLLFKRIFAKPPALVTSALVIAEGHGWFLRRYDRQRADEFLAFISVLKDLTIQPFDGSALPRVRKLLRRFDDQDLTLADAHGLDIMHSRKCGVCWSTDRHMSMTGVALATKVAIN